MLLLPFTANRWMFELLETAARGMESLADRGLQEALAPAASAPTRAAAANALPPPAADAPAHAAQPASPPPPPAAAPPTAFPATSRLPFASPERFARARTSVVPERGSVPTTTEERTKMADTNLNDQMVKLVEFSILTIERGRERFLEHGTTIVTDDLTGDAFPNARVAEWTRRNPDKIRSADSASGEGVKPSSLRVYYNVLDRWPKEDLYKDEKVVRHDEEQLKILREIADNLKGATVPPPGTSGSSTRGKGTPDSAGAAT